MNRLTDMDSGWWPFLHLRPPKDEEMTNRKLLQMSIYFGPFYGVMLALALSFALGDFSVYTWLFCIAASAIAFFFAYKLTFAHFWNLRARRLNNEAEASAA
jgi:fatty acid desaturase